MRRIGVLVNRRKVHAAPVLRRLAVKAEALRMELVVCNEAAALLPGARRVAEKAFPSRIDMLLALGGDGTMLHAVRILAGRDVPVLGVNLGSLGFLTSVTEENLERALEALHKDQFTTSVRSVLECRLLRARRCVARYRALNDVVLGWGESSRVNALDVALDGESVASYTCDGLIVSTPTGSTGHSLSSGGPILHPGSPSLVISPICPHTLSNRPLVVSDRSTIVVSVTRTSKKLLLSVDGQEEKRVQQGDQLHLRKSGQGARFIHLPGYSYFSVLRQKLLWRGSSL